MLKKRKRTITVTAILLLSGAVGAGIYSAFWPGPKPDSNVITSDGTNAIREVTARSSILIETTCSEIFGMETWPKPTDSQEDITVRHFQVGDFQFLRLGDALQPSVGYGWFDDGNKFWWALKSGVIRTATFPGLQPLRELSFEGFRIHNLKERPVVEKREPWRKVARELADLDFRGATCVGNQLIAMFGNPEYHDTNLVEINFPSLEIVRARRVPDFFYDVMELDDDKTIVVKGDDLLGFLDGQGSDDMQVFKLGAHRSIGKDDLGFCISIRENDTLSLDQSGPRMFMEPRSNILTWRFPSGDSKPSDTRTVEIDDDNRLISVRNAEHVIGFANGFSLRAPQFRPDGKAGLGNIRGIGSRRPGFGILYLNRDKVPENSAIDPLADIVQTDPLPKLNIRTINAAIPLTEASENEYTIHQMDVGPINANPDALSESTILAGDYLYLTAIEEGKPFVIRVNIEQGSSDFVIEDARLCALTDGNLIIESQGRFLVVDRNDMAVIRDLNFLDTARFAKGHLGEAFIADRFDRLYSPAVIEAKTGKRLMYYPRYGAGSSTQQLNRQDVRWFGGSEKWKSRRMAGLTIAPAPFRRRVTIDSTGKWIYSNFGLLRYSFPNLTHTNMIEMPKPGKEPKPGRKRSPEYLPRPFDGESKFAFFPDNQPPASGEKNVGVVRSLEDPELAPIHLVTNGSQVWMDRNPVTGNFWVRVRTGKRESILSSMRMVEFDSSGKQLRDIKDFSEAPQVRVFLPDGRLICRSANELFSVEIH